jgi:hypothetical protein
MENPHYQIAFLISIIFCVAFSKTGKIFLKSLLYGSLAYTVINLLITLFEIKNRGYEFNMEAVPSFIGSCLGTFLGVQCLSFLLYCTIYKLINPAKSES